MDRQVLALIGHIPELASRPEELKLTEVVLQSGLMEIQDVHNRLSANLDGHIMSMGQQVAPKEVFVDNFRELRG